MLKTRLISFLKLFIPYSLWLACIAPLWFGQYIAFGDVRACYAFTQYFLSQIFRGVYPMWNPFNAWGRVDDFAARMIGEFNPFLYLTSFFDVIGFSFEQSYALYLVVYLFIGYVGFYLLAKYLFKSKLTAFFAYLFLVFSTFGLDLFSDIISILLIIPTIWFFALALRFYQQRDVLSFLGLSFCLMIIHTTYLPFHFYLTLLSLLVIVSVVNREVLVDFVKQIVFFARDHFKIFLVSVAAIGVSLLPGIFWMLDAKAGDYVMNWRGKGDALGMNLQMINEAGMIRFWPWSRLWSHLYDVDLGSLYVPLSALVVLLIGAVIRLNKKVVVLLALATMLFVISLANITPLHAWLYEYVFFMKFFRNLHFFVWFVLSIVMLLAGYFLSALIDQIKQSNHTYSIVAGILIVLFTGFLFFQEGVVNSTWITLAGLLVVLVAFAFGYRHDLFSKICLVVFLVVCSIQPLRIAYQVGSHFKGVTSPIQKFKKPESTKLEFSFVRPHRTKDKSNWRMGFGEYVDTSGYSLKEYYGLRWSLWLLNRIPNQYLEKYTQNKLLAYDDTRVLKYEIQQLGLVQMHFIDDPNKAIIKHKDQKPNGVAVKQEVRVLSEDDLTITKFNSNRLDFNMYLDRPQFIVYNDAYHKDWNLTVNGKPSTLHRSTVAFKGFWLDKGANQVSLKFRQSRGYLIGLLYLVFFGMFGWIACLTLRQVRA